MNLLKFHAELLETGSSAMSVCLTGVPSGSFTGIQQGDATTINDVGLFVMNNIDMLCDFDNFLFGIVDENKVITLIIASYETI